jgi:hypothetical protein
MRGISIELGHPPIFHGITINNNIFVGRRKRDGKKKPSSIQT